MELHIANTFDKNRLNQYYVLLSSIFAHNRDNIIRFHVVATGLDNKDEMDLAHYIRTNNSTIRYYNVDTKEIKDFPLGSNWTMAVYYRLLLFHYIPREVQRILYLDTDTIVLKNLDLFFSSEMGAYPVAAVYDNYVKVRPELGFKEEGNYFNSGVMLIHLLEWKKQKISERALDYLKRYPEHIKFVEQDALNVVLRNNWLKLSKDYNFMYSYVPIDATSKMYKQLLVNIVIVHFTLERPWHLICRNRFRSLYYHYHRKSPLADSSAIKDFKSDQLISWMEVRLSEVYMDVPPFIKNAWKRIKRVRWVS